MLGSGTSPEATAAEPAASSRKPVTPAPIESEMSTVDAFLTRSVEAVPRAFDATNP
jgi:hypothetical protein